jgi:3-phosphoshikimate 1-carboxyvinyltransferase
MTTVRVRPAPGPLVGDLTVPGDKSIAHRALLLGAFAEGRQVVRGIPRGADVVASLRAIAVLGAAVDDRGDTVVIEGAGARFGTTTVDRVDCANSGTTMRLLAGMLAAGSRPIVLDGDASLRRRPMERIAAPLRAMGARVDTTNGCPPLRVEPAPLHGIEWTLPVASAQVKSAILLAALRAMGPTVVREPYPTRDHTERMLMAMGVHVECRNGGVTIHGGQALRARTLSVPGDPSSAAFFAVAAAIVPGSRLVVRDVGVNPTRDGFLRILRRMGAAIEIQSVREVDGEPLGDLVISAAPLRATDVAADEVPGAIDELPILAVAAACALGETRIVGAQELRVKESDRLDGLGQLAALGVEVEQLPDGLVVRGRPTGAWRGARVSARGDHRLAMAFAIAALRVPEGLEIEDAGAVDVSFPGFFDRLEALGVSVEACP